MNALGLRVAARQYSWLERRLFEVLGAWVATVPEPEAKVLLRAQSFEHAWHADLWAGLEPRSAPSAASRGPNAVAGRLAPVLDAVAEPGGTLERLVGAYRVVVPRLVDAYRAVSDAAVPASDGPLVRAVGLMLADDVPAVEYAEQLIGQLLASAGDRSDADRQQRHVERLLTAAGGVTVPETC